MYHEHTRSSHGAMITMLLFCILYTSHMHTCRPRNCPDEIADVMSRCHMHKRNERITFEQIVEEFSKEDILKLMGEKEIEISGVY